MSERWRHFNDTVGAFGYISALGRTGANLHPDRCVCQSDDPTPHKHRAEPPHTCARCLECQGYRPAILPPLQIDANHVEDEVASLRTALAQAVEALEKYGRHPAGCQGWTLVPPGFFDVRCSCGIGASLAAARAVLE